MISHDFKCVFIHQRKCAGSSIIRSFGIEPGRPEWNFMNEGFLSEESQYLPKDYFVFSVVRNPWDRFISGWKYCESTRNKSLDFVIENMPKEGHDYRHLTRPQCVILNGGVCNFIMRFERLQEDFDKVCDLIKRPRVILPRFNVGKNRNQDYRSYYKNDKQIESVGALFAQDIHIFKYEFDRPVRSLQMT